MKTRKMMSLMLTIIMTVSMMVTLGISASAVATDSVVYEANNENATGEVADHNDNPLNNQHPTANVTIAGHGTLAVEGYTFAGWNTQEDGKGTTYQPGETITISESLRLYAIWKIDNECCLDINSATTDIPEKIEIDQNYNLTVTEGTKTDITKVKLSWEIKDINATRTDSKVWNTTELCWETDSSSTTINQQGSAKFTLENYSSVKVDAKVTFKAEDNFKGTASYDVEDGKVTLDTANGDNTYSKTNVPTNVINTTITTAADDFKNANATTISAKYGTYTVTICKYTPTSFVFSGFYDGIAENAKINGMTTSAFCRYMVDNGMIADACEFGDVLIKYPYYSKLQKQNVIGSRAMSLLIGITEQEYGAVTGEEMLGDNDIPSDKNYLAYFNGTFTWDGSSFNKNS